MKRFDPVIEREPYGGDYATMQERHTGDYVLFDEFAAAQADAERWRQFLRNPYAAWDKIRAELDVNTPAFWQRQANAGIDALIKECGK